MINIITVCGNCKKDIIAEGTYKDRNNKFLCEACSLEKIQKYEPNKEVK